MMRSNLVDKYDLWLAELENRRTPDGVELLSSCGVTYLQLHLFPPDSTTHGLIHGPSALISATHPQAP